MINLIRSRKAFTLIELMIVVAIIGILAAIAIPQFAQLISKSQEGATKGNLGTLRSSLSIYYGDTEGYYPQEAASLTSLTTAAKYLQGIPQVNLPKTTLSTGHGANTTIENSGTGDTGSWYYNNNRTTTGWGQIVVDCSHKDLKSSIWSSY